MGGHVLLGIIGGIRVPCSRSPLPGGSPGDVPGVPPGGSSTRRAKTPPRRWFFAGYQRRVGVVARRVACSVNPERDLE